MSTIYGLAKITASDYAYVNNMNQELLYSGAQQYINMANVAALQAMSAFVDPTPTTNFKERYQLGLTGRMQRASEETTGAQVARTGSWDVAYPIWNFHESMALSDVDAAYMTPQELQLHVEGIITRHLNAKRHEILYRVFNNTQDTFTDKRHGTLTIEPLANGDSVVYPPVEGSESEAAEDHYLESGYAASAISDTNNPVKTLVEDLVHHGVNRTEDIPCAVMINPAQVDAISALTNFVPYIPGAIARGADTDQVNMPSRPLPGKVIGYVRGYAWITVWNWIPSGYMVAVNLEAPQPLKMRVDPAETNLGGGGLVLLPEERNGVLTFNSWRLRFGLGAANRLSCAVMELADGAGYTIPTAYQ